MALTEAQKRANKKWLDAHPYSRITFLVDEQQKEEIKVAASKNNESVSEYSKKAVLMRIQRDREAEL